MLNADGVIRPEFFPQHVIDETSGKVNKRGRLNRTLEEMEREHIQVVLRANGNNRTKAAEILGISPVTVWRRLKEGK